MSQRRAVNTTDLGLPSPRLLGFLLLLSLPLVFSLLLLLGGTLLRLLFLAIVLLGSRRNVLVGYMADLPGSLELLLILFNEILETIEIFGILKGFLDVFDDLGSDTAPVTPRTVVGSVSSWDR